MTRSDIDSTVVRAIEKHASPILGELQDYDEILQASKGKRFVLLGEASHGSKEFYRARAEITERLISEENFDAVAIEGDWPDAYRVNRFVSLQGEDDTAEQALGDFKRFPAWMWRNREVERFIHWLYAYNKEFCKPNIDQRSGRWPVGFYGLDLYSLNASIHAVIDYLEKVDPVSARSARKKYGCLYQFMKNPQAYGQAMSRGFAKSCEDEVVEQLVSLRRKSYQYLKDDGFVKEDEYFCALQNAELVRNSEGYYRALYQGHPNTWNLRDMHMFQTLEALAGHLGRRLDRNARIVVWAHNSHVGNAGATEMFNRGEYNIGQIVKSKYSDQSLLVGFSTCRGSVSAASNWGAAVERKKVREPIAGSFEELFHHVSHKKFLLDLRESNEAVDCLMRHRLQRAIGVIYRPETERESHYLYSCLPEQFDFIVHYDNTQAVEPLTFKFQRHQEVFDETYPYGV